MTGLIKREPRALEAPDVFDRFDRLFEDWSRMLPFRGTPLFGRHLLPEDVIRVDEYHEDGALVVRADLPGIDPDNDVTLTVSDGVLHIEAERREEEHKEDKGYVHRELRYGSFARALQLPEGVAESDIVATYKDGILEIRIPAPTHEPVKKIAISKS